MADHIRNTVTLPAEVRDQLAALRQRDRFCRCTYSQLARQLMEAGLKALEDKERAQRDRRGEERGNEL